MERGSAMRWTAGSYPAAHVPILAGRRGKGVKCTSSRGVWQANSPQSGRTRRSKASLGVMAKFSCPARSRVAHCSEGVVAAALRGSVLFTQDAPRRRRARCAEMPRGASRAGAPTTSPSTAPEGRPTATDTYTEKENTTQRKYSGAGLFCGTPRDSCGAASNIRYVRANSPSNSNMAATFPQR